MHFKLPEIDPIRIFVAQAHFEGVLRCSIARRMAFIFCTLRQRTLVHGVLTYSTFNGRPTRKMKTKTATFQSSDVLNTDNSDDILYLTSHMNTDEAEKTVQTNHLSTPSTPFCAPSQRNSRSTGDVGISPPTTIPTNTQSTENSMLEFHYVMTLSFNTFPQDLKSSDMHHMPMDALHEDLLHNGDDPFLSSFIDISFDDDLYFVFISCLDTFHTCTVRDYSVLISKDKWFDELSISSLRHDIIDYNKSFSLRRTDYLRQSICIVDCLD